MEFGETESFYTLIFCILAFLAVFPPHEVKSAGLTIENLFQGYFGDPNARFVLYHMRRIALTKCIHALLPTIYLLGLLVLRSPTSSAPDAVAYLIQVLSPTQGSLPFIVAVSLSLSLAVVVLTVNLVNVFHDWTLDPLASLLASHSSSGSWRQVAFNIDAEVRRFDKFTSAIGNSKLYVTDTWLIQADLYSVQVVHQRDATLELCKAEEFVLSPDSTGGSQFLEILVKSRRNANREFRIRLNSFDYRDLKDKLRAPVENARNIVVQQSLSEKFIQAFQATVAENPTCAYTEEVEPCIGCMQVPADVKLEKRCADEDEGGVRCTRCFCRPMWCCSCMARWFASRQDTAAPETWLSGSSPCPTCRATFCLLDVAKVQS